MLLFDDNMIFIQEGEDALQKHNYDFQRAAEIFISEYQLKIKIIAFKGENIQCGQKLCCTMVLSNRLEKWITGVVVTHEQNEDLTSKLREFQHTLWVITHK